jgi:hypothetical protein
MMLTNLVGRLLLVGTILVPAMANGAERETNPGTASLDVRPKKAFAGSSVRILVRVPADADNRWLRLVVNSEEFSSSSEIELEGDRRHAVSGTAGHYEFGSLASGPREVRPRA